MNPAEILKVLTEHQVAFVVVGGTAAVLQGTPITTLDVDIVYLRNKENIGRLKAALDALDAEFRTDSRHLKPNASHLESTGHKLLQTRHGILDVLGSIEEDTQYDDLLPYTDMVLVNGLSIQVLSLERLITVKEKLARPKDQLMLLQLRATLAERRKGH